MGRGVSLLGSSTLGPVWQRVGAPLGPPIVPTGLFCPRSSNTQPRGSLPTPDWRAGGQSFSPSWGCSGRGGTGRGIASPLQCPQLSARWSPLKFRAPISTQCQWTVPGGWGEGRRSHGAPAVPPRRPRWRSGSRRQFLPEPVGSTAAAAARSH